MIRADGGEALVLAADVSDEEAVDKLVADTEQQLGPIDAAFNNAGVLGAELPRLIVTRPWAVELVEWVADIVGEAPLVHGITTRGGYEAYVDEQMRRAGLDPAFKRRYPHQFSGGQRQRIGIARALAVQPDFLVCDEAVAALDVSIQAQILNLFMELRRDLDLTYLFISHDLGVVEHLSDRVVIMYLGRVVEQAPAEEVFRRPNHPYTQSLLDSVPRIEARKRAFTPVQGEIPSPLNPPSGCHFHPRCRHATERCKQEVPRLREVAPSHFSACHLNDAA